MKRLLISLAIGSVMFTGAAMAASAKFAAVWSESPVALQSTACASTEEGVCGDLEALDDNVGFTLTTIRVPQNKELMAGLSAEVGLFTSTQVKGKRGSYSKALSAAGGSVALFACTVDTNECVMGKPGTVILSARIQELEAILAGVIDECTFDVELALDYDNDVATGDATFDLGDCVVADEMISLALSTMEASHFNFVFPDMNAGDYNIVAYFVTAAYAEAMADCPDDVYPDGHPRAGQEVYPHCIDADEAASLETEPDGDATAIASAFIGKTMLTVQEVRAVKGSLNSREITEIE